MVVKPKISDDSRVCRIGGANLALAVHKSARLVEIGGLGYIRWDNFVVLPHLGDAIHLNRQQHLDAVFFQLTRQSDGFRSAPAMPVKNDSRILFFFGGQSSIMVRVQ